MQTFIKLFMALAIFGAIAAHADAPRTDPPRCMVDQFPGNFHTGISVAGDTVTSLWCDDQISLDMWGSAGNITKAMAGIACLNGVTAPMWSLAWIKAAWVACVTIPFTQDQQDAFALLVHQWYPHLSVAAGANRNVYTANPDGSKGPQLVVGSVGEQIAPGLPCGGRRLANAGARYHVVTGNTSTDGQVLPAATFALCTIFYPPVTGWP